jgi:hypothetical protein
MRQVLPQRRCLRPSRCQQGAAIASGGSAVAPSREYQDGGVHDRTQIAVRYPQEARPTMSVFGGDEGMFYL